ncbi:hypothetical protein BC834DRAFT_414009 [Gloeopeniophorella convolvens]|nr:hypothetical protein BC834DRAFT_414009 [Gloeopeniophorella convolvens]
MFPEQICDTRPRQIMPWLRCTRSLTDTTVRTVLYENTDDGVSLATVPATLCSVSTSGARSVDRDAAVTAALLRRAAAGVACVRRVTRTAGGAEAASRTGAGAGVSTTSHCSSDSSSALSCTCASSGARLLKPLMRLRSARSDGRRRAASFAFGDSSGSAGAGSGGAERFSRRVAEAVRGGGGGGMEMRRGRAAAGS